MTLASNTRIGRSETVWLEAHDVVGVERFLRDRGWLADAERVGGCAPAGEGNMNVTLRVVTDRRSLIVKQARPWVAKYPEIPAPRDRLLAEARFYHTIAEVPAVAERMPRLLAWDADARVIVLEDIVGAADMTSLYRGRTIGDEHSEQLGAYLAALHDAPLGETGETLANREMRALNHAHIFEVPLTALDAERCAKLEPGLDIAARALATDENYRTNLARTGSRYLADGDCLVHGDFFPGSWLAERGRILIIDAEFSFRGDAEFDLGCALAHLALARQTRASALSLRDAYRRARRHGKFDEGRVSRYAAAEVMRRLIGVAQLPIPPSDGWRSALLARSCQAMLDDSWERLW